MPRFTLESVQMTPPYKMTIIAPDGARIGWEWANMEELRGWIGETEHFLDPEVILRWAIKKLHDADPTLSQLPALVGKSFEFTPASVGVLP